MYVVEKNKQATQQWGWGNYETEAGSKQVSNVL
jgi:hypothetical protein